MDLFFDLLRSVIYGVIEGITEWLPISSTGHMILAEQVLKFSFSAEFMEMFRVVIQLGAILAVVVMYFKKLWPFCVDNGRDSGLAKHVLAGHAAVVQDNRRLPACRRAGPGAGRLDRRTFL